eukprot:gene6047-6121_t
MAAAGADLAASGGAQEFAAFLALTASGINGRQLPEKGRLPMIIVAGWVRMAPEDIERLRSAATAMMHATQTSEPGCLDYAFSVDLAEPGLLRVIERWQDEAALAAHFATPHMATFNAAMAGLCG